MLTKEQLLALAQPAIETVNVEGLGEIRVKVMDGFARDLLQKTLQEQGTSDSVYFSAVIVATVVDEKGEPMFSAADLDILRGMSAETVRRIGLACSKVNALGASQTQEAEKNSGAIQSDSSGTA
ncbi:hypothetical protein [Caballeronia sp. GAFFF2]|uniref:hypothetical protein n=1 Tax=Caballeronia sp. GAFFF2 TaxID=2921741 RepID=UPI0020294BE3|nr:hypothetical protein [Caballeronia sp. GAFFF2]